MLHSEQTLSAFLEQLAARQPTPGGGSTSALGGALGAALGSMAAAYTLDNPKYKSFEPAAREIHTRLETLRAEMMLLLEADVAAYERYRAAAARPKGTESERAVRSEALADAREESTAVPEKILSAALDGLDQIEMLTRSVNPLMAADVAAAAYFLEACARGAAIQIVSNCAAPDGAGANAKRRAAANLFVTKCGEQREKVDSAVRGLLKIVE